MKCLCVVVLLLSASFGQIQGPSDGDKNDSSSGNMNNDDGKPIDNISNGNANNNNNNDFNNLNAGAFNTNNNGDLNNINNGNSKNSMNGGFFGNSNGAMTNGNFNNINGNSNNFNNGGQQTTNNYNVGNPDLGNITRPCNSYDTDCIRRFFAEHAYCKVAHGPIPEPLYRDEIIVFVPRVNLTLTFRKVKVMGVSNGRIEEFYVNQDTDKVVIAIEFRGLVLQSNNSYFRIHRRSKEPIVVKDTSSSVTYQSVIITAIIPKINNLQLERTVVFAYVNDPNPLYMFGPRVTQSKDPEVQATYAAFLTNPRANIGEIFLTDAPYYPATFIQYNICDFGLTIL